MLSRPASRAVWSMVPSMSSSSAALAGELAQAAQGDLDVARAQLDLVVEVLVLALVPDLDRLALALAGVADADALGVVAARAERAGTAGTDPLVAAGMALLLFLETFLEFLDQLVQASERLDLCALLVAQAAFELLAQPVFRDQGLDVPVEVLQALEVGAEGPVELVEVTFVLDHHRARQEVELFHVGEHDAVLQGIDQIQQLADRYRHLGRTHLIEQAKQHGETSGAPLAGARRSGRSAGAVAVVLGEPVANLVPVGLGVGEDVRLRWGGQW
ncbi:hypothetical protein BAY1663_00011 [Pseudomonas sp. BAY1663]|nr:hypothetical protein BAY1663_00011 [Pseudomonas sp. BAY1663]